MINALSSIRFSPSSPAARISKQPILVDLLDQEQLSTLVSKVERARAVASEAGRLAAAGVANLDGLIDDAVRDGVHAEKLVDQIVEARSTSAARKGAADQLTVAANRYLSNLEVWLNDSAGDLVDLLSDKLSDLLDRAADVTDALGSIDNADDAIEAGLAAEWARHRAHHREYVALREAHRALVQATAPGRFGGEGYTLAFAYFRSPLRGWPQLAAAHHYHVRTNGFDVRGVAPSPFDLQDPADPAHFWAAVTRRAEFGTHVADASEALTEWGRVIKEAAPRDTQDIEGGDLQRYHGSEAAVISRGFRG